MRNLKKPVALFLGIILSSTLFGQAALKRANKQYELGDFSEAVKSYAEVLEKQPNHLEANSKIADSYRHLNELEKALPHYETAVNQAGVDNLYVFQYGLVLQGLGRYEPARGIFDRLAANSPEYQTRAKQFAEAASFAATYDEPPLFKVANEYVNTPLSEFGPVLFKGERVIYTSGRKDIQTRDSRNSPSGTENVNRLFITQRDKNGFLETPVTLHTGFKNETNEGPIAYSPDGKWVAITKNNFRDGIRQIPSSGIELTLYIASADESGDWTNAVPFPHNGVGFSSGYPAFSQDGNALYFASDRPGGYGGFDLWVSYRTASTWSVPENLGTTVNSLGNEISPFLDGNSLYFASDYHRGFGGFDIFRAEESNGRWATIYHGGSGLNSSSDDYGFTFDPIRNIGYFVSNRPGGKGNEDLYRIVKETDNVVIKVTDAATGQPLANATIDFTACGDKSFQTNANGVFNFQIMENLNCSATVSKAGYFSKPIQIVSIGIAQNRTIEVALTGENTAYRGKILNGATSGALSDVKVIVTNQKTNEVTETSSDAGGSYLIALQPSGAYVMRFSKAGYRDVSLNFSPAVAVGMTVPNVELLPVGFAGTTTPPSAPATTIPPPPPASKTPAEYSAPSNLSGYAVQLAAVSSSSVDLTQFQSKIGATGQVYAVQEGGMTKVRAGVFATRAEAEQLLKNAKANGFPGAFIVDETGVAMAAAAQPQSYSKEVEAKPVAVKLDGYMVRLATYRDLKSFNASKAQDLGNVTQIPKGDMTIVLLTGYDTKQSADAALQKAKARGFKDAYLVIDDKGELRRAY